MSEQTTTLTAAQLAADNRETAEAIMRLLGTERQFDYFADDVVLEFPYGEPARFEHKDLVAAYVRQMMAPIGDLEMRDMGFYSVEGNPNTVFVEYHRHALTPAGDTYLQTYLNKMDFRDGKLIRMRELSDPKRLEPAQNQRSLGAN